ncbi:MAG TPA: homoserine kinase [Streptosporangiaceae bacterium]|jgi:homoserine kinase|nr:homoserine kinase [Streptosporangiaceae bacterium]
MTQAPSGSASGWPADPVRVRVPATSANLGPGFDSLGLALTLYDEVEVAVESGAGAPGDGGAAGPHRGVSLEVTGEGTEVADRGEDHLIVKTIRRAFDVIAARSGVGLDTGLGAAPPCLRLRCSNRIPHSRGLGSSAAAIVAGLIAARELHPYGRVLDDQAVYALATEIEGHPDNVAACLAGGLTIAWRTPDGPRLARVDVDMEVVVFVPEQRMATERTRGLLPDVVPHEDAAANAGRAALLMATLTASRTPASRTPATATAESFAAALAPDALLAATEDRIHQGYRAAAMPASAALLSRLREKGIPAVLSGAGPAVLAFTTASRVDSIASEVGNGWHKRPLNVDPDGARVQPVVRNTRHRPLGNSSVPW